MVRVWGLSWSIPTRFYGASEEHGHVDATACVRKPQIGERVQVLPVHLVPCVNEHNEIAAHARRVEAVWPVFTEARFGKPLAQWREI